MADERRPPARAETIAVAPRTKARERGIDKPQLVGDPSHFVNLDVSRGVRRARHETSVMLPCRWNLGGHGGQVMVLANLHRQPDRHAIATDGESHQLEKARKCVFSTSPSARNTTNRPA